ncbi:hypothetical protein PVAP13_8KG252601 [Panicum virgatum]|uniref:Uncharacterized protein n=1 Tax=Panicum virgatum TaxID=38727 RepID=A0A8T0PIT1_PANVG|nr:hypothetical protein PVAP13_8KG252601 [Panicum virgatum]
MPLRPPPIARHRSHYIPSSLFLFYLVLSPSLFSHTPPLLPQPRHGRHLPSLAARDPTAAQGHGCAERRRWCSMHDSTLEVWRAKGHGCAKLRQSKLTGRQFDRSVRRRRRGSGEGEETSEHLRRKGNPFQETPASIPRLQIPPQCCCRPPEHSQPLLECLNRATPPHPPRCGRPRPTAPPFRLPHEHRAPPAPAHTTSTGGWGRAVPTGARARRREGASSAAGASSVGGRGRAARCWQEGEGRPTGGGEQRQRR